MPRDYDDEDDRPRRRGARKRKPAGAPIGLLVGLGAGVLVLAAVVAGVVLLVRKPAAPPAGGPDPAAPDVATGPGPTRPPAGGPAPAAVRAVALPLDPALLTSLVFAGGDDGHAATVTFRSGGGEGGTVNVFAAATGVPKGKVEVALPVVNGYAVSPDGKWLAALTASATEGQSVVVYAVADGSKAATLNPYPRRPGAQLSAGLGWVVFLPGDRLMTVSDWGGADVWALPGMTRVGGRAARGDRFRSVINPFTKAPTTFALAPDGKTLAVLDGAAFGFSDPVIGAETVRTTPYTAGRPGNEWAAALRADGAKLAFFYSTHDAGQDADGLVVWDARTGKAAAEHRLPVGDRHPAGCSWWGPDHLLTWLGAGPTVGVVDARTGKVAGQVRVPRGGRFVTAGGGDRLWAVLPGAAPQTAALVRADPPPGLAPGATFELTRDGLAAR
ncbi:hypothetical protein J0H58_34825 [bacterium]|nr:hypothetical protein [bacterium]